MPYMFLHNGFLLCQCLGGKGWADTIFYAFMSDAAIHCDDIRPGENAFGDDILECTSFGKVAARTLAVAVDRTECFYSSERYLVWCDANNGASKGKPLDQLLC